MVVVTAGMATNTRAGAIMGVTSMVDVVVVCNRSSCRSDCGRRTNRQGWQSVSLVLLLESCQVLLGASLYV